MQKITLWLKKLVKRLAVSFLSGIIAMIASFLIVLPFLFLFKWLFGPVNDTGSLTGLIDGWYIWLIILAMLIIFWKLLPHFDKWFARRFGLVSIKVGLKLNDSDVSD